MDLPAVALGKNLLDELKRSRLVVPASDIRRELELIPSGLDELDEVCGGGLPAGRISELVAPACGGASVLYSLLASVTAAGELAALIDPADGFNVASARARGVALERLLWVRARGVKQALRAVRLVLETGGFRALALDLGVRRRRERPVADAAWMHIKKLAAAARAAVLVVSATGAAGTFASLAVEVRRRRARWRGRAPLDSWLAGVDLSFTLLRKKV